MQVTGTHVRLENMELTVNEGSTAEAGLEIDVDDQPSTAVHCDQCKTWGSQNAVHVNGLDHALIDIRIGAMNAAALGGLISGGPARAAGYQTVGRVDGFMTSIDAYDIRNYGHFLVEDGWHDAGQGKVQFALAGTAMVTQQGGTVYTGAASGMTTSHFSGRVSLLGISTDSTFNIDSTSDAKATAIGTIQVSGSHVINSKSETSTITQIANYSLINNGVPTPYSDEPSPASTVEHMFSQARTDYVVPRVPLSTSATNINLHRVLVAGPNDGITLAAKQSVQASGTYSIVSSATRGQPSTAGSTGCPSGDISMSGEWSLQGDVDGFYGLKRQGIFLSNRTTVSNVSGAIGLSRTMADAGQRWIIRPTGDGLFNIINRANGKMLTSDGDVCATLSTENEKNTQEWAVSLFEAAAN
jgi:hypothetical protein